MSSTRKPKRPVLGQRYRLIRQLDAGGMGSVWVAEAVHLRSLVAVKIMDQALAATPEAAQRFLREARTSASLRSPHVVQILDYGVHENTPFIVMELLEGESLATRLKREGRLASWDQAELVLRHVARALGRAHDAGVIHRDLKPANIFLVRDEEEELTKLLDFGIAKTTISPLGAPLGSSTRTGEFLGSPAYSSPEQLQGSKALDHRADIWSLGVIAYECLLGRAPFASDSFVGLLLAICVGPPPVPSEQGAVPAGFDAWFARACARDVEERFPSVREASAELKRVFGTANGSRPATSGPDESSVSAAERAAPVSLEAEPEKRAPSRTDTLALGAPPTPSALPTSDRSGPPTQTVRLDAPGRRFGRGRGRVALWAALTLPALLALVFFTLETSTSRAALDRKRLALAAGAPSEPLRSAAAARGKARPPVEAQQRGDAPDAGAAVALRPAPRNAAPDPSGAPEPSAMPAPGSVPPDRVSQTPDAQVNPPERGPSASARAPSAATSTSRGSSAARLTITAHAPSEVLLDGVPIGTAPLAGVRVAAGAHEVTFIQNGQRSTERLTLRSGEHKHIESRLEPPRGDGLDEAVVKRTIKRNRDGVIDSCWNFALVTPTTGKPSSVRVPVTISVEPSGVVRSAVASAEPPGYPDLCRCVEARVSAWSFPSARAETVVSVAFVFVLE